MKIRMRGNSIRLRLGRSEVEALCRGGQVEDRVEFGPLASDALVYEIRTGDLPDVIASFEGGRITVVVPGTAAVEWAGGEGLSLSGSQPLGGGENLSILIEKDLACKSSDRAGGEPDAFPDPADAACC